MNDDEKRLLLACASCLLAQLTRQGPDDDVQIRVLRAFLEPFGEFMREDLKKEQARRMATHVN